LTPKGRDAGLVDDERWQRFEARNDRFQRNLDVLQRSWVRVDSGARIPAAQALRRPELSLEQLESQGDVALDIAPSDRVLDLASVETAVKYEGYLLRQQQAVSRARRAEIRRIPDQFPFDRVPGLSREMVQRFSEARPETLGQAQRIPGVTPAAVAVVGAYLDRF
jgi:tRNA uridine 5-carboxymethylaminomethyl modification enzyme